MSTSMLMISGSIVSGVSRFDERSSEFNRGFMALKLDWSADQNMSSLCSK